MAEHLSPNALLRPVVQDYILPTASYIGGPAELAYLAQSQVLYRRLLGRMPVAVPRTGFTLFDARACKLMRRYELHLPDFFHGFDTLAALQAMEKSALRDHAGLRFYSAVRTEPLAKMMEQQQRGIVELPDGDAFFGVAGYARTLEGESIGYYSSHPDAGHALIARATDGKKPVVWETAPVPAPPQPEKDGEKSTVSLVWLAGLASGVFNTSQQVPADKPMILFRRRFTRRDVPSKR